MAADNTSHPAGDNSLVEDILAEDRSRHCLAGDNLLAGCSILAIALVVDNTVVMRFERKRGRRRSELQQVEMGMRVVALVVRPGDLLVYGDFLRQLNMNIRICSTF